MHYCLRALISVLFRMINFPVMHRMHWLVDSPFKRDRIVAALDNLTRPHGKGASRNLASLRTLTHFWEIPDISSFFVFSILDWSLPVDGVAFLLTYRVAYVQCDAQGYLGTLRLQEHPVYAEQLVPVPAEVLNTAFWIKGRQSKRWAPCFFQPSGAQTPAGEFLADWIPNFIVILPLYLKIRFTISSS